MRVLTIQKPKHFLEKCALLLAYFGIVCVYNIFHIPCIWQYLFHIPCPGCGMTTAWRHVATFDIPGAFSSHMVFWCVPLLLLYYFFDGTIFGKKWDRLVFIVLGLFFLINWVYHLFLRFS
ncbi:MAG: DUF2752 domain-containing protein [Clostridia bacterium]|nr:DUF2752 domain-containing protein [Clostridia bacterium]